MANEQVFFFLRTLQDNKHFTLWYRFVTICQRCVSFLCLLVLPQCLWPIKKNVLVLFFMLLINVKTKYLQERELWRCKCDVDILLSCSEPQSKLNDCASNVFDSYHWTSKVDCWSYWCVSWSLKVLDCRTLLDEFVKHIPLWAKKVEVWLCVKFQD